MTGDGIADLLGIDAGGVMYRHNGTGGGVGERALVGNGWNIFQAVF